MAPWVACALAALVILEGGVIAALLMRQPDSVVASTNGPAAPSAPAAPVVPAVATGTPIAETPAAGTGPPDASREIERAATSQRSGGVRLVTPIELKVLEGDRVLGSTADGPIIASAGTRQLDLINTALGLRVRQTVTFRANVISSINVQIPPGRLSVNAQPWAEVLIDDKSYGETPLANLNVPIGEHEIVFRHPEHGERRQTFVVRADQPNRVSVTFER